MLIPYHKSAASCGEYIPREIKIDGKQVGGTLTAHAEYANDAEDMITVKGDWGQEVTKLKLS